MSIFDKNECAVLSVLMKHMKNRFYFRAKNLMFQILISEHTQTLAFKKFEIKICDYLDLKIKDLDMQNLQRVNL